MSVAQCPQGTRGLQGMDQPHNNEKETSSSNKTKTVAQMFFSSICLPFTVIKIVAKPTWSGIKSAGQKLVENKKETALAILIWGGVGTGAYLLKNRIKP